MGKPVTTYLIDGNPKGTQYAFISNKICHMFVLSCWIFLLKYAREATKVCTILSINYKHK